MSTLPLEVPAEAATQRPAEILARAAACGTRKHFLSQHSICVADVPPRGPSSSSILTLIPATERTTGRVQGWGFKPVTDGSQQECQTCQA